MQLQAWCKLLKMLAAPMCHSDTGRVSVAHFSFERESSFSYEAIGRRVLLRDAPASGSSPNSTIFR
jgi:ABC-type Na+ transport system ATPase subunit NatA